MIWSYQDAVVIIPNYQTKTCFLIRSVISTSSPLFINFFVSEGHSTIAFVLKVTTVKISSFFNLALLTWWRTSCQRKVDNSRAWANFQPIKKTIFTATTCSSSTWRISMYEKVTYNSCFSSSSKFLNPNFCIISGRYWQIPLGFSRNHLLI